MAKVLVMIPAGAVYDHDCVRWYRSTKESLDHYHNIGDAFVHDSSLKLLDYESVDVLQIAEPTPEYVERVNEEYDLVILRGSNYLHSSMRWWRAAEVLPRLKIPVLAFGVGAQAPTSGKLELSDESIRIWRMIADSTESVGVRGAYTAEVLWDIGVRNARIVGCPTLFRGRNPELRIDLPDLDTVQRVGVTLRREVSPSYSSDVQRYLEGHRTLLHDLSERFDVELMAQGEVEEKQVIFGDSDQREAALKALRDTDTWTGKWYFDDTVEKLYREKLFYSDVVSEYDALVRGKDLVLGFRLHGNLMALANGIPAIYFTYDSRTAEFVETFSIPAYDVHSAEAFDMESLWDQARFERFNMRYHQRYRDMLAFLDENQVAHRLPAQGARVKSAEAVVDEVQVQAMRVAG